MAVPYRYDLGFKVNGTPIPDPMEFGGSSSTLDTAAGRDATGHLHRSPVAVKNPLKIGWSNIDWEMITRIMRLVVATNFSFTYPDPTTGGLSTRTCYSGDRSFNAVWMPKQGAYIGNLSFSVIEY